MNMGTGLIIVGLICLVLMLQRWFWLFVFGIGSVVSCFALLGSIIHFQLLGALGYFCLMLICWSIAKGIASANGPSPKDNMVQETRPTFKTDDPDWSPP